MKKVLLVIAVILLVGCSNTTHATIEDEKFTFSDEEFKEVYEEVNDKNLPTNVKYYPELISIQYGGKNEAIDFLKATAELLESDEVRRLSESIESGEDNIPNTINGEGFSVLFYSEYDKYDVSVRPFEVKE